MIISKLIDRIGIRARLVILLSVAFAPLVLLVGSMLVFEYETTLDGARNDMRRLADVASAQQSGLFAEARVMLETLRQLPEVGAEGGAACVDVVTRLKAANPKFHTIGVTRADQMVTCHSKLRVVQRIAVPEMFERTMRPQAPEFNVGEFFVGPVSGKPTVVASLKLAPIDAKVPGTVFASMNLTLMAEAAKTLSDDGRRSVIMIEAATGKLLMSYPPLPIPFGTPFAGDPLVDAMMSAAVPGDIEATGLDGTRSIYGFAPLTGTGEARIMVAVGSPRAVVLAPVYRNVAISAGACALVMALAFAGTWQLGYWMQLRPIDRLRQIADRIGAGGFDARASIEPWQAPELRSLGASLDAMAARLEEGRRAEEAVAVSEARYRLLAENTADLVTSLDADGRRLFVSPASRDLLGREPEELLAGRPRDIAYPDDLPIVEAMMEKLSAGVPVAGVQYRIMHRDGHSVWVEVGGKPLEGGRGTVLVIRDISERKAAEVKLNAANERLAQLANTDGLTGLGNRRSFDDRLRTEFDRSVAEAGDLSLVLIDVDWFKRFNDTYGHLAGDDCLRLISATIGKAIRRPGDHAARFGGEELALILPGTSVGDAIERAETVRQAVEALDIGHAGSDYGRVTISIGVVSVHAGAGFFSPDDMLRTADQALYEVKANGRNAIRYAMSLAVAGENRAARLDVA